MADRESLQLESNAPGETPTAAPLDAFRVLLARAALSALKLGDDAEHVAKVVRQIRRADADRGDLALTCFELAKLAQQSPPQTALQVANALSAESATFQRAEAAGPYVNVSLAPAALAAAVVPAARAPNFGHGTAGRGRTVLVDFSSPNIAKPLAFHHIRSTVIGAALARLHAAQGWTVAGINYLGDWGKQFGLLATGFRRHGDPARRGDAKHLVEVYVLANQEADVEGLRARLADPERFRKLTEELMLARREREASAGDAKAEKATDKKVKSLEKKVRAERGLPETADPLHGLLDHFHALDQAAEHALAALPAAEARDREARLFFKQLEEGEPTAVAEWQQFREASLLEFQRIYARMHITFTHYEGESFYNRVLEETVARVAQKPGVREDQGATVVDLPYADGQPPILLKTRDGTTLYITRDLAAAQDRFARFGFDRALYVVAQDQALHFQQLFRTLEAMGFEWASRLTHVPFGRVHGMSTRRGNVVFLDEVLDESVERAREICAASDKIDPSAIDQTAEAVGVGAVVFGDLKNLRTSDYTFRLDDVVNFDGLTGPYVQFSHARLASILRKAGAHPGAHPVLGRLTLDEERQVLLALARFPEAVAEACEAYEPSILTRAVLDLAQTTASYLTSGNKDRDKRVLVENDPELQEARLALVDAVRNTLARGLAILGLQAPEAM